MLIGFVSDAHGNPTGLSLCLERLCAEGVKTIFFLGDAFGYLPQGLAVVRELRKRQIACIMGNHDAMTIGLLPVHPEKDTVYRIRCCSETIPPDIREAIRGEWHEKLELTIGGKRLLLVHGRPAGPLCGYLYENDQLAPAEWGDFDVIVTGHTHRPYIKVSNNRILLNAGSCGLPRDIGNLASCAMYDTQTHRARILRVPMDVEGIIATYPPESVAPEVVECLHRS